MPLSRSAASKAAIKRACALHKEVPLPEICKRRKRKRGTSRVGLAGTKSTVCRILVGRRGYENPLSQRKSPRVRVERVEIADEIKQPARAPPSYERKS